jgi:hypothetical protein
MGQLTTQSTFSLTPNNLQEAMQYSEILAKSTIVPKNYQNRSGDILVAIQMGAELGLKPIQSLQSIAVINGRPSVYGDGLLALVQAHASFEDIQESFDEEANAATCIIKRKNQSSYTVKYTKEDAEKAGLWGKIGPWKQYPKRMLQMRARGFALRDKFADALGGLITAEEAQDMPVDVTPKTQKLRSRLNDLLASEKSSAQVEDTAKNETITHEEEEQEQKPELSSLILKHSVPLELINKWCEKAGADNVDDLESKFDEAQLLSCKNYIIQHYSECDQAE